jgi:hypothetical protein
MLVELSESLVKFPCNFAPGWCTVGWRTNIRPAILRILQSGSWQLAIVPVVEGDFLSMLGSRTPEGVSVLPPISNSSCVVVGAVKKSLVFQVVHVVADNAMLFGIAAFKRRIFSCLLKKGMYNSESLSKPVAMVVQTG